MRVGPKLIWAVSALFTFTAFILIIVATSGCTSNYKPINNIYIGEIDISHIKVEKLLPETGPILAILAAAMKAPNASYSQIFDALRTISHSEALTPLMNVLKFSNDSSQTLGALEVLAPAALEGNDSSTAELNAIYGLLKDSKNSNETLRGLSALVVLSAEAQGQNSSTAQHVAQQQQAVFELLEESKNVTGTVTALASLDSMSQQEKQQLAPVFMLFNHSNSLNSTLSALSTLMTAQVSSQQAEQLFDALSSSNNVEQTLQQLQQSSSGDQQRVIGALATLLSSSSNGNQDLRIVQGLYENNITQSASAKQAFSNVNTLITASNDPSDVLTTVSAMANSTTPGSAESLRALEQLLVSANNETLVLTTVSGLQSSLSHSNSEKQEQMKSLFSLLNSSTNPTKSFEGLLELTAIAKSNPKIFVPILGLLDAANSSDQVITAEDIDQIMPDILQYLNIAERFRLGIFTNCRVNSDGKVMSCSNPYAVQGLDIKEILFTELENSDFRPYLQALNIQKDDIILEGKLPDREHQYEPAVRALLALNILAIICAFFLLIAIVLSFLFLLTGRFTRWIPRILAICVALFSVLAAIIAVVVTQIIKEGTSADKYNVVHRSGRAYYGMVWTAFVLAFITMILLFLVRNRKKDESDVKVEEHSSSSILPSEKQESVFSPRTVTADEESEPALITKQQ